MLCPKPRHAVVIGATMAAMKGRTGFVLGVAVGYVLGARAGRARYEQLADAAGRVVATEPVQAALDATAEPRSRTQQLLADQLRAAGRRLRTGS